MIHPPFPDDPTLGGAVVFAQLLGMTCSICAPVMMSQDEVEAAATIMVKSNGGAWRAVDKSQPPVNLPPKSPSRCNVYADRQHWFLLNDVALRRAAQ